MLDNEPGYFDLLFELFIAGRHNPEIQREVGELFRRSREHVVEILRAKEAEGVIAPRFDLESVVSYLFSIADGIAMQVLSEPDKDFESVFEAGTAAARHLLSAELAELGPLGPWPHKASPRGVSDLTRPGRSSPTIALPLATQPVLRLGSPCSASWNNLAAFLARRRWWVAGGLARRRRRLAPARVAPDRAPHRRRVRGPGQPVEGGRGRALARLQARAPGRRRRRARGRARRDRCSSATPPSPGSPRRARAGNPDLALSPRAERAARAELAAPGRRRGPADQRDLPASELTDAASDLRDALAPGEAEDGVTPYLAGQPAVYAGLQELSKEDLQRAELLGFPIVALILLAVFGSIAAATLPLALGFGSVIVTGALIYLISQQMEMSVFVTNMASMIGIGVAVDYSLFILARFREEVRAGRPAAEARARGALDLGLAVLFSGLAVIISLAGLWMVDNQTLRSMALGAMIVVAISILTATLLLPALIRILGHRVEAGGVPWSVITSIRWLFRRRRRPGSTDPDRPTFWERWTARVMARPVVSVVLVAAVLLTLAIPVLDMKTGNAAIEQFPRRPRRQGRRRPRRRADRRRREPGRDRRRSRLRNARRPRATRQPCRRSRPSCGATARLPRSPARSHPRTGAAS